MTLPHGASRAQPRSARPSHVAVLAAIVLAGCADGSAPEIRATKITLTTAPNPTAVNRVAFAVQPVVQLQDASGASVRQSGVSIIATINSGAAVLGGTTTVATNASGVAAFSDLSIAGPVGPHTLEFRSGSLASASASISTSAGAAAKMIYAGGDAQTTVAGGDSPVQPSVRVVDADDNPVTDYAVTFRVTSGGGSVLDSMPLTLAGGQAVTTWTLGVSAGGNTLVATAPLAGSPVTFSATGAVWSGVKSVGAGSGFSCALTQQGDAYCWGVNNLGQLGDGTTTDRSTPAKVAGGLTFVSLTVGWYHACGVTTTGAAVCWGYNAYGGLGDSTFTDRSAPVAVKGNLTFRSLSAGSHHTCGITTSRAAYCWGLGGAHLGDGKFTPGFRFAPVTGGIEFRSLSANHGHTCGESDVAGALGPTYCWGENRSGELGIGSTTPQAVPAAVVGGRAFDSVSAGETHTCALYQSAAYCWGWNFEGEIGDSTVTSRDVPVPIWGGLSFRQIGVGQLHSCGITPAGAMYCWGRNVFSQLGDGTSTGRLVATRVQGGLTFEQLSTGTSHTCGLANGGVPYCWGLVRFLGNGTAVRRLLPTAVPAP
jgi:alpha-tubulin suppressor-like RCC1 family protein